MKRFSPRHTIRGRLLLLAVVVEAIMLTILVANSLRLLDDAMTSQSRLQVKQMHPVLEAALIAPMAQRDYATVQAIIDESRSAGGVDYVAVVDTAGNRVASSGWSPDRPLPMGDSRLAPTGSSKEHPRYDVNIPIVYFDQKLGTLHFGLDLSQIATARRTLLRQGAGIAAAEIVLSSFILLILGYWLTRHLARLTEASMLVASGNFTPPPVQEGNDDVGRLGAAFNTMSRVIGERVRELTAAKENAEESERRLRCITDSARDAIIMINPDGIIGYWNTAAEKILGYRAEEALGKNLHRLLAPERFHAAHAEAFAHFRSSGRGEAVGSILELAAICKNGTEIPVALSLSAVQLNGQWHAVGILRDISDIKRNEAELRAAKEAAEASERAKSESEERLKLVLDGSNDGIWDWNLPTGRISVNRRWAEMMGYALEEVELDVKTWETHVHPDDLGWVYEEIGRHLDGHTPAFEIEYRMRKKSGELFWTLDRGKVVARDGEGKPVRAAGTHTDITKRKLAEAALRKSEEQVRLLLNSTAEAIYGIDLAGNCTFANPSCLAILGYGDAAELLGTNMHELIHYAREDGTPMTVEECSVYRSFLENRGVHRDDEVFWRKDGTCFPVEYSSFPQVVGGEVTGAVVTFTDITERREAEKQLHAVNREMARNLEELVARNREIALLGDMTNILQTCRTVEEAFSALSRLLPKMFSPLSGALYLADSAAALMEAAVTWGDERLCGHMFNSDDCWGLRRGKPHVADDATFTIRCAHLRQFPNYSHMCVPLAAQGEVSGVLYLHATEAIPEDQLQLGKAVGDSIILSLANLKLRESLHLQSISDPLTGLYNRRFMEETLNREGIRAHRSKRPLGVMMIDIDHFKKFNDTYGHEAGDTVLRAVGNLLKSSVRGGDVTCRYGGEEFAIILPEVSLEAARERAESLRAAAEALVVRHAGEPVGQVTISIGIAAMHDLASDPEAILRAADAALYQAKRDGRNRVVVSTVNAAALEIPVGTI